MLQQGLCVAAVPGYSCDCLPETGELIVTQCRVIAQAGRQTGRQNLCREALLAVQVCRAVAQTGRQTDSYIGRQTEFLQQFTA